jgi:ribosomal-protein-alanine N-acetyltransferase
VTQPKVSPATEIRCERLRWWNIPAAARIEAQLFEGDSPWSPAMFWSELAAGHFYLAAWSGKELVGYAGLARLSDLAEVQTLAVVPGQQGRGIGRLLLSALLSEAGKGPVALEVRTDNQRAIALYESFGFSIAGVRRRYYQPSGSDAYRMLRPA